mmetsp:Transcript_8379/g.52356  ORF Transcript_8379/g.52356 Transcript_8379/m.52356 type:complete len:101 (-) Transcript_8379:878-1180(-)
MFSLKKHVHSASLVEWCSLEVKNGKGPASVPMASRYGLWEWMLKPATHVRQPRGAVQLYACWWGKRSWPPHGLRKAELCMLELGPATKYGSVAPQLLVYG